MKYKIAGVLSFLLIFSLQLLVAQNPYTDANGRTREQLALKKDVKPQEEKPTINATPRGSGEGEDKDEGVYERGENEGFADLAELGAVNDALLDLAVQFSDLKISKAALQAEIDKIKSSLEMCCGGGTLIGQDDYESYLMQNAPNPFSNETKIQFFIPDNIIIANLQIRDLSGKILQSYALGQRGIADVIVERKAFESGSYVYTLEVDGKIVDSKIMILTK